MESLECRFETVIMARVPSSLRLSEESVAKLVRRVFPFLKVDGSSVKQLQGYDDRNFYFRGVHESTLEQSRAGIYSSDEYVLKVSDPSTTYECADGQNCLMKFLKGRGFNCPCPVESRNGRETELLSEAELFGGEPPLRVTRKPKFCTRVLTYVCGEVVGRTELSPELGYSMGEYVGRMDAALQEFTHPVIDSRSFSEPSWDLRYFLQARRYVAALDERKKREMAGSVMKLFQKHVSPKLASFRCGTIHYDTGGSNMVWGIENGKHKITGVIDFGDSLNTCYVFELAILLAYVMTGKENPIQASCPVLSGYCHAFPLSEVELDCLYYVVLARLCQLLVVTEEYCKRESWNTYLFSLLKPKWALLEELLAIPKEDVDRMWSEARNQTADDFKTV